MSDRITILRSRGLPMAKTWRADGAIEPYSRAKHFTHETREVKDIAALSDLLTELEADPCACIIRGQPKPDSPPQIRRLIESVDDLPLHALCIEVDNYRPLLNDPLDGEAAALEFITECLPGSFHASSFHWQLSNSAGAPGKEGLFKAHLWFWLETTYDSATLRAWAKMHAPEVDRAVLQPVQVHYTAAPVFEEGVLDPVGRRSGLCRLGFDSVQLRIDLDQLNIRAQGVRQRGERRDVPDPQADFIESKWETWGHLADGGIIVSCPFAEQHSGGAAGDTSTVYFPKGTNGYEDGMWVCLHNSCRDRNQAEFHQASGWLDAKLGALNASIETEPKSKVEVNGRHVNGVVVNDPLVLPPFRRNGAGTIETCLINVQLALQSPKVNHLELRYDLFKDAVVCADRGSGFWRPFADVDYTRLRLTMEKSGLFGVGRELIRDGVYMVAQERAFDTAIDWLESLEWDGLPRVESFWVDHFGVIDTPYARAVGLYTWTALAGRVLVPGVQADMVPILTGRQGLRKSRGVKAMAPAEFATHMNFHEAEVERARKMRGKLIIELAELQGLKSRDAEEILAWVTRSEEHWTPKFMEMTTEYKRRFLLVATTNEDDFLDNPKGERRWLPLAVGRTEGFGMVDTARLGDVREQLWAEGAHLFREQGVMWQDAERLAQGEHGRWKAEDSWAMAIRRWLDTADFGGDRPRDRKRLSLLEVAEGALNMPARNLKPYDQRRIGKVLRDEGYEDRLVRVGRVNARLWVPTDFC